MGGGQQSFLKGGFRPEDQSLTLLYSIFPAFPIDDNRSQSIPIDIN